MSTVYDSSIDEWICTCAAGEFYGITQKDAEAKARDALRIANEHQRKKSRKIGPGVYAVGPLGEIEMDQSVIDARRLHGLSAPATARHLTGIEVDR